MLRDDDTFVLTADGGRIRYRLIPAPITPGDKLGQSYGLADRAKDRRNPSLPLEIGGNAIPIPGWLSLARSTDSLNPAAGATCDLLSSL